MRPESGQYDLGRPGEPDRNADRAAVVDPESDAHRSRRTNNCSKSGANGDGVPNRDSDRGTNVDDSTDDSALDSDPGCDCRGGDPGNSNTSAAHTNSTNSNGGVCRPNADSNVVDFDVDKP